MSDSPPFIRRVRIQNYKSIAACDVELGNFNVIVGRNGSGKSNFLDALRFVADSLQPSLDFAFKSRGGVDDVFRRSSKDPSVFEIKLDLAMPGDQTGEYGFSLERMPGGRFRIGHESLQIETRCGASLGFRTENGILVDVRSDPAVIADHLPSPALDHLYLMAVTGFVEFRLICDALRKMRFYNLSAEQMRSPHPADSSPVLQRDGSNLASVAGRLFDQSPELKQRLLEYLGAIVPDVIDIRCSSIDGFDYLRFQMRGVDPEWLRSNSMSDGTLRVLGNLISSMQCISYGEVMSETLSLVAIEEPETALHPAAAAALLDALREASLQTQIIITSHSPDLLDGIDPDSDSLLVAQISEGRTEIDVVDAVGRSAIHDHLFSAGELLRLDQLKPQIPALAKNSTAEVAS